MAPVLVGERISADDPLSVENDQVAPAELVEQRRDRRLIESCTVRDLVYGRGSSVFEVELKQRNAHAIRGGIVAAPAIENVAGPDHGQQGIPHRLRRDR
jgi:hypothetical protein